MSGDSDEEALAYTELQPEHILETLENLSFRCDGRFLALNSYENRVYQIGIEDSDPIVAKFYRPGRWSDDAILEEHRFTWELADQERWSMPYRHATAQSNWWRWPMFLVTGWQGAIAA